MFLIKKSFSCLLLSILHFFLGISAILGGASLIISPNGQLLNMHLPMLENSSFNSFLIPGFILFFVIGVLPLVTSFYLFSEKQIKIGSKIKLYKHLHLAWNFSLYNGFILIIWITIEIYMIQAIEFIQVFYIILGLIIQFMTLLPAVKNQYTIQ
ncbi:hypothetical protein [Niallia nealsonii]|uniref:Uncharacterized protein n=1 Tax=Niallia nealsonii TaxID=115979 RepID=A0A2N0Z0V0_9BACI|nr:hypothetical protein [Niallia nealsonii]PKG23127.1 hypothetical protein CWS01_13740 [Niallia nealsonii]